MALTCDGVLQTETSSATAICGMAAVTTLNATVLGRSFEQDLCEDCARDYQVCFIARGARPAGARVDYKTRAAYITASGIPFTAEEARKWLVERDLAKPRGRLSATQLQTYAEAH